MRVGGMSDELKEGEVVVPPRTQQHTHPCGYCCFGQGREGEGEGTQEVEEEADLQFPGEVDEGGGEGGREGGVSLRGGGGGRGGRVGFGEGGEGTVENEGGGRGERGREGGEGGLGGIERAREEGAVEEGMPSVRADERVERAGTAQEL